MVLACENLLNDTGIYWWVVGGAGVELWWWYTVRFLSVAQREFTTYGISFRKWVELCATTSCHCCFGTFDFRIKCAPWAKLEYSELYDVTVKLIVIRIGSLLPDRFSSVNAFGPYYLTHQWYSDVLHLLSKTYVSNASTKLCPIEFIQ